MKFKSGVNIRGVSNEITLAIIVANYIWQSLGQRLVVTSCIDGKHSRGSFHYSGNAIDLRTRYFEDKGQEATIRLKEALTDEYDVVLESTHIHIEYQPKGPTNE